MVDRALAEAAAHCQAAMAGADNNSAYFSYRGFLPARGYGSLAYFDSDIGRVGDDIEHR